MLRYTSGSGCTITFVGHKIESDIQFLRKAERELVPLGRYQRNAHTQLSELLLLGGELGDDHGRHHILHHVD
jgi:hypothetical protein